MTQSIETSDTVLEPACKAREYEVSRQDLPLSCPTPEQKLWNAHPRVYLPIEETGSATCPYCGSVYRLID